MNTKSGKQISMVNTMSDVQKQTDAKRPKSVYIDPELHLAVKVAAAKSGVSIQAYCETALCEKIAASRQRECAA